MTAAAPAKISPDEIRSQVERILNSAAFTRSKRQQAFLEFITNAALEDRLDELKEYTLGVEVFQRDVGFDPSNDSIVRVEASRLRTKLREYYDGEGWRDPIVVEVPKGRYAPTFEPTKSSTRNDRTTRWAILLGVVCVGVGLATLYSSLADRTESRVDVGDTQNAVRLAVLPLRNRTAGGDDVVTMAMTEQANAFM